MGDLCQVMSFILLVSLVYSEYTWGPPWSWSYGSCIYNYLCNQCLITTIVV